MVPGAPSAPGEPGVTLARARDGGTPPAGAGTWSAHEAPAQAYARPRRVFERLWHPCDKQVHAEHPYVYRAHGMEYVVSYEPGESSTGLFGGNSNWRGPIWFPINYLLIET